MVLRRASNAGTKIRNKEPFAIFFSYGKSNMEFYLF